MAGTGDIDHVVISPAGVAFAVETKTRRYEREAIARVRQQAGWLAGRHGSRRPAVPVFALAACRGVQASLDGVQVLSLERLLAVLLGIERDLVAEAGLGARDPIGRPGG